MRMILKYCFYLLINALDYANKLIQIGLLLFLIHVIQQNECFSLCNLFNVLSKKGNGYINMGGKEIRVTFSLSLVGSMINFPFKICKDNAVTAEFKQMGDNFYSGALLCGEFRPPLPEYPKYIHFHTVFYMGESIKVIPSDSVIILNRSDVNQTLHIIEPPGKFLAIQK